MLVQHEPAAKPTQAFYAGKDSKSARTRRNLCRIREMELRLQNRKLQFAQVPRECGNFGFDYTDLTARLS